MKGNDGEVIPSLMDVLREAMEAAGKQPRHIRYRFERSEKQIERYIRRESFPPADELERFVVAVAEETDSERVGLWRKAVDRAEQKGSKKGPRAVPDAEPQEHSPRQTARVGRRRPRATGGGQASSS